MAVGALGTMALRRPLAGGAGDGATDDRRRSELVAWLSALSLAGLGQPTGLDPGQQREAKSAAGAWLRLVDSGRHPAAWGQAAPVLREEAGPVEWEAALRAVRAPLGRCYWRTLQSGTPALGPTGAHRGPYLVLRFETVFERRHPVVETVTTVQGPDGRWRVAAYFLG